MMKKKAYLLLNGLTLAYIGDSYYELCIRKYMIDKNYTKVNDLHRLTIQFVSAVAQAKIVETMLRERFLTPEEEAIVRRGRNSKPEHRRPNVDLETYRQSTGFEALIGYLYLMANQQRLDEVIQKAIEIVETGDTNG